MPAPALSVVPSVPAVSGPRAVLAALVRQRQDAEGELAGLSAAQGRLQDAAREVEAIESEFAALEAREAAELRA